MVITAAELPGPEWVYPCTVDDLRKGLADFPSAHLEGLNAVRLVPSTRRNNSANGRYFYSQPSREIHLYSHVSDLQFKFAFHGQRPTLEDLLRVELSYGMALCQVSGSWVSQWQPEPWRTFVLDHVLAHEVGHHVYHFRRYLAGYVFQAADAGVGAVCGSVRAAACGPVSALGLICGSDSSAPRTGGRVACGPRLCRRRWLGLGGACPASRTGWRECGW